MAYYPEQERWAAAATPPVLHEREVAPVALAELSADAAAFQGWRAAAVGPQGKSTRF